MRLPAHHQVVLPLEWNLAAALLWHRPLTAVLVGIVVMFLVSLAAFLLYIITSPPNRGGGH